MIISGGVHYSATVASNSLVSSRAAVPNGDRYMTLRDEIGPVFNDDYVCRIHLTVHSQDVYAFRRLSSPIRQRHQSESALVKRSDTRMVSVKTVYWGECSLYEVASLDDYGERM